jgi:hypothetical protein
MFLKNECTRYVQKEADNKKDSKERRDMLRLNLSEFPQLPDADRRRGVAIKTVLRGGQYAVASGAMIENVVSTVSGLSWMR